MSIQHLDLEGNLTFIEALKNNKSVSQQTGLFREKEVSTFECIRAEPQRFWDT